MNDLDLRAFESSRGIGHRRLKRSRDLIFLVPVILFLSIAAAFSRPSEESWTDKTLRKLTLREKIAQLVQIRVPGKFLNRRSPEFVKIADQIRKNHVGGLVLFAGNVYESAILLNEFQTISELPLLVAADFERGASFRIADTTAFPWTMALGAADSEQLAYQEGLATAKESRALGVHWIYAPVMDVNSNPDNPVINIRAFGEDPKLVARLGTAFIHGAQKGGVMVTAKHFPGHGDTATDSHIGLPVIGSDMDRLQSLEFIPFRSAIDAGVDSIMTAHVAVPRVTGDPGTPATLSSAILTETLRNKLNFQGIVVTDALEMAGISDHYWCGLAAVRAIQAGADVLLLPPDAAVAINEVERAVARGDISMARIDASVRKILDAKSKMHLQKNRLASISDIGNIIASPQNTALAQEIADRSITVVKDEQHLLPIDPLTTKRIFSLVLASDQESSPGTTFQNEIRQRFPSARTEWANARISEDLLAGIDKSISDSDLIVCATLVRLTTGQKGVSIPESHQQIIQKLLTSKKPVIWIALGNPYVLRLAPRIGTYLCTFSYSENSQIAAAKALSGAMRVTGKMPVSIPGISLIGEGIEIPKLEMSLRAASPEELGIAPTAFEKTAQLLTDSIENQTFPGAELIVGYQGKIALDLAAGKTGYAANSATVSSDTIYDLTSLSFPFGATMAAMQAIEAGGLILNSSVKDYIPEIGDPQGGNTRIQSLLNKNAGSASDNQTGALLENVISRSVGMPWHQFLAERLFAPLGMKNTFRIPPPKFRGGIAQGTGADSFPLLSNTHDIAIFAQMILNRGVYAHRRYVGLKTIGKLAELNGPWTKASETEWTRRLLSDSAFGHNAANGSCIWIDPSKKLFYVLLTNGRQEDSRVAESRRLLGESILSALFP